MKTAWNLKASNSTCARKLLDCIHCDFLKQVNEREGRDFVLLDKNTGGEKSRRV